MYKNIYITGSFCCAAQINTTLEINYISIKKKKKNSCCSENAPGCFKNLKTPGRLGILRLACRLPVFMRPPRLSHLTLQGPVQARKLASNCLPAPRAPLARISVLNAWKETRLLKSLFLPCIFLPRIPKTLSSTPAVLRGWPLLFLFTLHEIGDFWKNW